MVFKTPPNTLAKVGRLMLKPVTAVAWHRRNMVQMAPWVQVRKKILDEHHLISLAITHPGRCRLPCAGAETNSDKIDVEIRNSR